MRQIHSAECPRRNERRERQKEKEVYKCNDELNNLSN